MHFYSWRKGLKTGMYYLRTKSAVDAVSTHAIQLRMMCISFLTDCLRLQIKFTVDQKAVDKAAEAAESGGETYARVGDGGEGECISCGA